MYATNAAGSEIPGYPTQCFQTASTNSGVSRAMRVR